MGAPFCLLLHQAILISLHTHVPYTHMAYTYTQVNEPWTQLLALHQEALASHRSVWNG